MATNKGKKRGLGRGLDGMLPPAPSPTVMKNSSAARIEQLHRNPKQPRRYFDDEALAELAASITEHGVIEPIVVRKRAEGEGYEIIAGERRWRASQKAGLKEVPIFVRELSDSAAFEQALVENIQREDLNAIETALAFQRLMEEFGHTQEEVAQRVGKSRVAVSNFVRLLKLPQSVMGMIESGQLSEGHGRALLMAPDVATMEKLARAAVAQKLSVREIEKRARAAARGNAVEPPGGESKGRKSANILDLERRLSHSLGATVSVEAGKGEKGKLEIAYSSYDELDRLISELTSG